MAELEPKSPWGTVAKAAFVGGAGIIAAVGVTEAVDGITGTSKTSVVTPGAAIQPREEVSSDTFGSTGDELYGDIRTGCVDVQFVPVEREAWCVGAIADYHDATREAIEQLSPQRNPQQFDLALHTDWNGPTSVPGQSEVVTVTETDAYDETGIAVAAGLLGAVAAGVLVGGVSMYVTQNDRDRARRRRPAPELEEDSTRMLMPAVDNRSLLDKMDAYRRQSAEEDTRPAQVFVGAPTSAPIIVQEREVPGVRRQSSRTISRPMLDAEPEPSTFFPESQREDRRRKTRESDDKRRGADDKIKKHQNKVVEPIAGALDPIDDFLRGL